MKKARKPPREGLTPGAKVLAPLRQAPARGTKKLRFIKRCTTKFHLRPQKSRRDVDSSKGLCMESTLAMPGMNLMSTPEI